jgi:MoaA/NifB/PqqE/SkfB family radical SAM enzyme
MNNLPESLLIETYSACNRSCSFCAYGQDRFKKAPWPKEYLSWEIIKKILSELRDARFTGRLSWYRINEPLLDERIEAIYAFSRKQIPDVWLTLVTNGDFLTQSRIAALFSSGINVLGVSLYDDPSYTRLLKMIEKLPWESGPPGQIEAQQRIEIRDHRKPEFWGFCNRGGSIDRTTKVDKVRANCLRPSSQLAICANGKAVLCCNDLFGDVELGDIAQDSICNIWNSQRLEEYRDHLKNKGRYHLPLCEHCDYSGEKAIVRSVREWSSKL